MTAPVRLAKRLAESVPCSRREAELYIAGGWVTVDGQVVEEPQFMVSQQRVELHPEASLTPVEAATILFHLPPDMDANAAQQLICADTRAADDPSGIHLLKQHFVRLTQGIPLERNASGLLVFTQDWHVARKLKDDAATLEQEYVVEVAGELPADGLKLLNHGLSFNGRALPPVKVSWQNQLAERNPAALCPQGGAARPDRACVQECRAAGAGDETAPDRASVDGQIAARAMALLDAA